MSLDLVLIMPVYNEEGCIGNVLRSWRKQLSGLGIDFRMLVLNDGSSDGTAEILKTFADDPQIEVINKENSGHGPTILMGYRQAVDLAEWVFQCDSDNEIEPDHFKLLWKERSNYDALFGERRNRRQSFGRKIISACSRLTVRLVFGRRVPDVNTPYRLMRSGILREIVKQVPDGTFAPNVIITGALARSNLRFFWVPVPHRGRKTGTISIGKWKLWRAAITSFWQTLRCRPVLHHLK